MYCWFCYNTDIQHLYQDTKHSFPHVLISFTTTQRDRYWFKPRSPGSERPSDSSKITELISDGWELDLGPERQFQGQLPVSCGACSMYEPTRAHTACSWEKLDLGLEAVTGVHLSDLQCPGALLVQGTSYCSEISLCLGWGQPPHRQLPANDWGWRGPRNRPFLGDVELLWLAGDSVSGSLWPCPTFLHWKNSSHLPSLFLKTDGRPTFSSSLISPWQPLLQGLGLSQPASFLCADIFEPHLQV